ncbi:YfiT family bacillithiol transferase [Sediminicola luteus]|uniref:Metal-dependent hydrolase n=1 Tax=Sediminicola luteus TaxID=319238 RepID=A0A2A4G8H7_9FLAO|nr:putative metal-dependent hydrolase [Sediminicola luteus]PCE64296.1 metal-dependent hydrolase [Sediminicola luteus]
METLEALKYPIGQFECPQTEGEALITDWIAQLETFPDRLAHLVKPLSQAQLDTPYRPGGWSVRQVVHHLADSHHNSYTRFRWALTEERPLIKVYDETQWVKLPDGDQAPIDLSLAYLKVLHAKMVLMLKGLSQEQMAMGYVHPEGNTFVSVAENIGKYVWHGNHHYAHIAKLIEREAW